MKSKILPKSFYQDEDVVHLSKALLGKVLVTNFNNHLTSGIIIETEAYQGVHDKASHAYKNRRTQRTEPMYFMGGIAYVYLCYGIHHLFNVVTAGSDVPHAVLVRALEPLDGISWMLKRRKMLRNNPKLTSGPGVLTQALGITTTFSGHDLTKPPIWIEDRGIKIKTCDIIASPRIGIDYAEEHKDLPWRFRINKPRQSGKEL